jgi:RimJ/RimL family protein N-acetyltransferase
MITLRLLRSTDRPALVELFDDPATRLWNPGPDDLDTWLGQMSVPAPDHRTWAVTDDHDRLLGVVSLFDLDPVARTAEIGFRVHPAARGRGVATAAVSVALAAQPGLTVRLLHAVENTASCRVAGACGFGPPELLPANWTYGDGRRHDEHRHLRYDD